MLPSTFKLSLGMMMKNISSTTMFLKIPWVAKGKAVSQAAQSIRKGQFGDVMEARIKVLSSMELVGKKSHVAVDSPNQQTSTMASVKLRESMTKLSQMEEEVKFIRTKHLQENDAHGYGSSIKMDNDSEEDVEGSHNRAQGDDENNIEGEGNEARGDDSGAKKRKYTSPVWEFAKKVDGRAVCNLCQASFVCPNGNTSNITGHLLGKHKSSENAIKLKVALDERSKIKVSKKQLGDKRDKENGRQLAINAFFPGFSPLPKKVKEEIDNNLIEFIICENNS